MLQNTSSRRQWIFQFPTRSTFNISDCIAIAQIKLNYQGIITDTNFSEIDVLGLTLEVDRKSDIFERCT